MLRTTLARSGVMQLQGLYITKDLRAHPSITSITITPSGVQTLVWAVRSPNFSLGCQESKL